MPRTFGRTDYAATRLMLGIAVALPPAVTIGLPLLGWAKGEPLGWSGQVGHEQDLPASLAAAGPGAELTWDGTANLTLAEPDAVDRLVALLPGAAGSLLVAAGALLLLGFVRRVQDGAPFAPGSVRVLRTLAGLVVAGAILVPLLDMVADNRLVGAALTEGAEPPVSATFGFGWFLLAVLLLVLAEAFDRGVRLADDVEGLV